MEIKTLRNFLEIAKYENMTRAADELHISQPTLSRQIHELEDELGQKLFIRHSFKIELTEEGRILKERAEDLVAMADKISVEFKTMNDITGGDVYFGLAESYQLRYLASAIRRFLALYPDFHFHTTSGDTEPILYKLDKGLLDFGVICTVPDPDKYEFLTLPEKDRWVVVMRSDDPLSAKDSIAPEDLIGRKLFASEQAWEFEFPKWAGKYYSEMHLEGSFSLSYNGSVFAREGLGILLTFDHLIGTGKGTGLVSRPLAPELETTLYFIWRKNGALSRTAEKFLELVKTIF